VLKIHLSELDEKGEEGRLLVGEIEEMGGITHDIHFLSLVSTSISWQHSRLLWLKNGNANSKYFHTVLSSRRRRNAIVSLMVNGNLVKDVQSIRDAVFSHFRDHFADQNATRSVVENLIF
jgi:hypothetical protein